jgi:serine phosphatase RsbU (regulator of sigma subunit)
MEDRQLGSKELAKLFLATNNLTPGETTKHLLVGTQAFAGKAPQRDDITILVAACM